jgi:uncharacterized protein (DUF2164 family)
MGEHDPEFFQTRMGHQFYNGTMPRIAKALEAIAEQLTVLTEQLAKQAAVEAPAKKKEPPDA